MTYRDDYDDDVDGAAEPVQLTVHQWLARQRTCDCRAPLPARVYLTHWLCGVCGKLMTGAA